MTRIARDAAIVALRNREFRLALALLIWPAGWSHTRLVGADRRPRYHRR